MNIIKSHEWEKLANIIKNEDLIITERIFDFLIDETEKY